MKTTLEIHDGLLLQAKRHAKRIGRPLRAVVEDGLRAVLAEQGKTAAFRLVDRSVGESGAADPLTKLTSDELRELIYGGR